MSRAKSPLATRVLIIGAIAAAGFGATTLLVHKSPQAGQEVHAATAPPAIPVNVQTISPQKVQLWSAFSGRMRAVDYAEIRPQVSGRITEVRIKDGQSVKAGDILFVIDPRPFEASLARATANLASAQTNALFAKTERERATNLIKTQAIPQRVYDERINSDHVAQAAIQVAEAEVKQARIDLDHAYVKAPIAGRVSRAEITLGNLVQTAPSPPLLTSIVSSDGIYAEFEVDEQTFLRSIRSQASTRDKEQQIPVELTLQGDNSYVYRGTIYSFDNHIDTATGTIRARARFANEDGSLVPGMFVSVKLASNSEGAVLLVPERAIGNDQSKKFVLVVTPENTVAYREVALGQSVTGHRIVLSGLQAGERVIVDGLQHVRPNAVVLPTELAADNTGHDNALAAR